MDEASIARDRSGIQVIARAVDLLRALRQSDTALSLGELAKRTNLPRSTVQRITSALLDEGMLSQDSGRRGLRLGPELARLGEAARIDVVKLCRPVLESLAQQTGETADLAVHRDHSMTFIDQVAGSHRLRTVSAIGEAFPLTTTANGRAVLARYNNDEALALAKAERLREGTYLDREVFVQLLQEVRASGLAYDREEHTAGICAVGFAFEDATGLIYAISVPAPASRFAVAQTQIEQSLRDAQKQLLDESTSTWLA